MNDTEYHTKIQRLPIGQVPLTRKPLMSESDMNELLTGEVYVEEKLDGSLEHNFFPGRSGVAFYENLKVRHSVYYDKLPQWLIVLDVTDDHICHPNERTVWGTVPPLIRHYTKLTPSLFKQQLPLFLEKKSEFATNSPIEGIVVKNYQKQLFGKVVNIEFYKGIEEEGNYIRRRKRSYNRLNLWRGQA